MYSANQVALSESLSAMSTAGKHILVYPFPTSGHIIPLLDLTRQLLTRHLTVTILVTPNNLPLLEPLLSSHPSSSLQSLVLPAPSVSSSPEKRLITNMRGLRDLHYPILLQWFQAHPTPPVAIISDFFLAWTQQLACQLGVPRVVFSPSGAFAYSIAYSLWRDLPINDNPDDMNFPVQFPKLPNSPIYPWYQIAHTYRNNKRGDLDWEFFRKIVLDNLEGWGIVFNSFSAVECAYVDHVQKEMGHDRVWAVGPVLPPEDHFAGITERGGSSSVPCHEVMTWLDDHKDHSVVYICFGSRYVLTRKQMDELAAALEQTEVHFIWCVRSPGERHVAGDYGLIPDGFEDRVAGRGFIIKGWASQVAILRHRAVGAFLTHCGWNSVMEGIAAGVVMLTWPMGADQFTNAKLLVDQLGVGMRVGEGTENIPKAAELARILAESVDESSEVSVKSKKLSGAAWEAIKGGSSAKDLDGFAKRLGELKIEKEVVTSPAAEVAHG